jgi:hypothetical protein
MANDFPFTDLRETIECYATEFQRQVSVEVTRWEVILGQRVTNPSR